MKKCCVFLLIVLLLATGMLCVQASAPRFVDDARLLTEQEGSWVQGELDRTSATLGMDVVVVTVDSLEGKSASSFADDYYDSHGYSSNGILLLISMEDREWHITTSGTAMDTVSDDECEDIGNLILNDLGSGDYADAFLSFSQLVTQYAQKTESFYTGWIVCIGIGVVVGLISVLVMKAQLKSVRPKGAASDYVVGGSFVLTGSNELFLFRNVSRVERVQSSSSRGGSSGRSHGGAGGRF